MASNNNIQLPNFNIPHIGFPDAMLPNIQLPNVLFPNVQLPDMSHVHLPRIPNFQDAQFPNAKVPENRIKSAAKEAVNIAKVLPMIFSIALHGKANPTEICKHFEANPLDITVDLQPTVHFMQIEAGDYLRDFREAHEKLYFWDSSDDLLKKLAKFRPDWPTKILVHGFQNNWPNKRLSWEDYIMYELPLATETNKNEGYNLFVVAYDHEHMTKAEGSNLARAYARMATTVPSLGQFLGLFLWRLGNIIPKINFSHFHLIGHSLGAHLVGIAGKNLQNFSKGQFKAGYITGLDPAGPCFEDNDADGRLDSSDAIRVDAIHSNKGGFGIVRPVGHIDVQLNNGINQPGASDAIESHKNAVIKLFYTHEEECQFLAYKCDNYEQYMQGDCPACDTEDNAQNCILFKQWPHYDQPNEVALKDSSNIWIKEPDTYQSYFTSTSDIAPFCHHIAQIDVRTNWLLPDVASMKLGNDEKKWSKHMTIKRSIRQPSVVDANTGKVYYHYTGLLEQRNTFHPVTSATLFAPIDRPHQDAENGDTKLDIKIHVQYRSHQSSETRHNLSTKLCMSKYNRKYVEFDLDCSD